MAIELHLQKTSKTSWGFRLTGGVEYETPLTVTKVIEDSIAGNAGMEVGDIVVRVNDIPMSGLTHIEAHDVLQSAGNDFIIAVRRGDLCNLPPKLLLYETSVDNADEIIKTEAFKAEDNDLNITDEEIANIIGEQVALAKTTEVSNVQNIESVHSSQISEEITQEILEETVEINTTQTQSEVSKVVSKELSLAEQEKKWSTFLQKPINPKPKPKAKEPEALKAPPYRVIIKKQPKKEQETPKETSSIIEDTIDSNITSEVEENIENIEHDEEESRTDQEILESTEDQNQLDENENYTNSQEPGEEENQDGKDGEFKAKDEEIDKEAVENNEEGEQERKLSINLEEQLAQVQQQLLALSQLPSAIQQTLNSVTQQLAEIVSIKQQTQEQETTIEVKATVSEEVTEEYMEMSEHEERPLSVLEEETTEQEHEEEYRDDQEEGQIREIREINESEDEQALFETLEKEIEEEERRKEEELEVQRMEQQKVEKRDKERRPSHPQTPLQRPIILPGGRKWSEPDDAMLKIRHPSMTDETIAITINTFSEVIVGQTMGINFLKYQPPPKNLEHLQRSAVYRLVHDMEPPLKGIVTRSVKILAEQDYYAEQQEEKDLPPQMER